jgi:hypothetical protein
MQKAKIIKRLEWYYPTELFNAWLFTGITLFVIYTYKIAVAFFLVYGLIIMTFILFQGQHYWKLKLFRLTNKKFDEAKNLKLFRRAKQINVVLIAIIPFVFGLQWLMTNKPIIENNLFLWRILANVIGVLEHINYYHKQLMVDNLSDVKYLLRNKKLKVASLKKDLDESKI